ncbi:CLUMA_CG020671, isoform A [Clunio marinus]|uniref:CLUMA_CG020671, isoform A n=1 Tax=Clunio marinus TaxID=568069 RepID=A0A1J1J5P9_9DIPT|nr:CLUMA_CG020671, isoform A [Clunio marinus]
MPTYLRFMQTMKTIQVLVHLFVLVKLNKIFDETIKELICANETKISSQAILHYFEKQRSIFVIDLSKDSFFNTNICNQFDSISIYVFNKWNKVNIEDKVVDSGLSAHSRSRGFFLTCTYREALQLFKQISDYNPRVKTLISLRSSNFSEARKLLQIGYEKFKMLDVAILMKIDQFSEVKFSICLYNPFQGDKIMRSPEFRCFNISIESKPFVAIDTFIETRVRNLHQFPLRVNIFEEPLLSNAVKNKQGKIIEYRFLVGETIKILKFVMNFTPIYITSVDGSRQGFNLPNGSFTGSLGLIEDNSVELAVNPIFIADYGTKKMIFLQPIAIKSLYFIIKKRKTYKLHMTSIFFQYDNWAYATATALMFLLPLIYVVVNKMESKMMASQSEKTIPRNIFYVYALIFNVSMQHSTHISSRMVVAVVLFYNLMISSLFEGTITKNLSRSQQNNEIKTFDQLINENYNMTMRKSLAMIFIKQGGSKYSDKLREVAYNRKELVETYGEGLRKVLNVPRVAYLTTRATSIITDRYYDSKTGVNKFESVTEPIYEDYASQLAPKHSPFIECFNFWINVIREIGITKYQFSRADDSNKILMIQRVKAGKVSRDDDKVIQLNDLASTFYLLSSSCVPFYNLLMSSIFEETSKFNSTTYLQLSTLHVLERRDVFIVSCSYELINTPLMS